MLKYENVTDLLINGPNPEVIPILKGSSAPLDISIGFDFINIVKVDEDRNEVEVVLWQKANWSSPIYAWNRTEPNQGVDKVSIPSRYVWLPDLTVLNGVSEIESPNLVVITSDGNVLWVTSQRVRVLCDVTDVRNATGATCSLKVLTWTYSGYVVRLSSHQLAADTTNYFQGSRYELLNTMVSKNSMTYPCCDEPYEDVTLAFTFKVMGVEPDDTDSSSSALKTTSPTLAIILAFCFLASRRY